MIALLHGFPWFCIDTLYDWLIKLAPLSQPIMMPVRIFPALGAGYMYLVRALIGSLDCLRLL